MITLAAITQPPVIPAGLLTMAYLVAGVLFVLSLSGLSTQEKIGRAHV